MANPKTIGVLLAGGLARRMGGGDKSLAMLGGEPLLARAITRIAPQCDQLILNANGDPARFKTFGLPVVADTVPGFAGPLAGVLAALEWVFANRREVAWVLSAPTDCPFLPHDLTERLHQADRAKTQSSPSPHPPDARILWSPFGRSRCVRTFATRSRSRRFTRSAASPSAFRLRQSIGRPGRSIRSSTSTRRTTSQRPNG